MLQLGSQKAQLRQKGIAFRGLKLKLEVQPPNVFIVPPCVCTFLCYRGRIVRYQGVRDAQYCERHSLHYEVVLRHGRRRSLA